MLHLYSISNRQDIALPKHKQEGLREIPCQSCGSCHREWEIADKDIKENLGTTQEINVTVEAGNPSTGVSLTAVVLTITALAGAAYIIRKNQTAKFFG